jgi:hypothetical protein
MAGLNLSLDAIDRSLAADSLAEFVRQSWPLIGVRVATEQFY